MTKGFKQKKKNFKFEQFTDPYPEYAPWPNMRGDMQNSGIIRNKISNKNKNTTTNNNNKNINSEIIHFRTGNAIFSTPIIGKNDVIYVGSADCVFYALDPHAKKQLWTHTMGEIIDSAACIGKNDIIYIAAGDAKIYAFNQSGKIQWIYDALDNRPKKYFSQSTNFWFEANIVFGPDGALYVASDDFFLYKMTPKGEIIWAYRTGFLIWSSAAFWEDGTVYIAGFDHYLYALDMDSGKLKWKTDIKGSLVASPAIGKDGTIYQASFNGNIVAVNHKTHKIKWTFSTASHIYASPALSHDNKIYFGSTNGTFYALDSQEGTVQWTFYIGDPIRASAAIGPDIENKEQYLIYFGGGNGLVYAISPQGKLRWTYDTLCKAQNTDYPNINASIALGNSGLCVCSSTGDIIWIPYNYYLNNKAQGISLGNPKYEEKKVLKWHFLTPGGRFQSEPIETPLEIFPVNTITLQLLLHDGNSMLPVKIIYNSIKIKEKPNFSFRVHLQSDEKTLNIIPTEILTQNTEYTLKIIVGYEKNNGEKGINSQTISLRTIKSNKRNGFEKNPNKIYKINHMAIPQPTIVPSLNQIGFASLTIPFRIVEIDITLNKFIAWGVQKFIGEGVPIKRISYYGFNGRFNNDYFMIQANNCLFEITAFNVPLDMFRIAGKLDAEGNEHPGGSLIVDKQWKSPLSMLREMGNNSPITIKSLLSQIKDVGLIEWIKASLKFFPAMFRQFKRNSWVTWGLINHENRFMGIGTFQLQALPSNQEEILEKVLKSNLIVKLESNKIIGEIEMEDSDDRWRMPPSIFIVDIKEFEILSINYSSRTKTYVEENVVTAELEVPKSLIKTKSNLKVFLMIDMYVLKTLILN